MTGRNLALSESARTVTFSCFRREDRSLHR